LASRIEMPEDVIVTLRRIKKKTQTHPTRFDRAQSRGSAGV
jgi:hypothetical protein